MAARFQLLLASAAPFLATSPGARQCLLVRHGHRLHGKPSGVVRTLVQRLAEDRRSGSGPEGEHRLSTHSVSAAKGSLGTFEGVAGQCRAGEAFAFVDVERRPGVGSEGLAQAIGSRPGTEHSVRFQLLIQGNVLSQEFVHLVDAGLDQSGRAFQRELQRILSLMAGFEHSERGFGLGGTDRAVSAADSVEGKRFSSANFCALQAKEEAGLWAVPGWRERGYRFGEENVQTLKFYRKFQNEMTPAGLVFFQLNWNQSLIGFYYNVLKLKHPVQEYDLPAPYLREWLPLRRPFNPYIDKYCDQQQVSKEYLARKLALTHPFQSPEPALRFPNAHPVPREVPSWLRTQIKKGRRGWGRVNDV